MTPETKLKISQVVCEGNVRCDGKRAQAFYCASLVGLVKEADYSPLQITEYSWTHLLLSSAFGESSVLNDEYKQASERNK